MSRASLAWFRLDLASAQGRRDCRRTVAAAIATRAAFGLVALVVAFGGR